ncbi:Co2+/Mg2+ efflux protein ApaG [Porticoccaceae bacterium LTM1]|nr:Co2+/Mg2+ efflux protein ApaG [Porticoccaceae bacterium LTM1]
MTDCPIQVTVQPEYLANQSEPGSRRFAFAYHITITNNGSQPAQLLSRHWHIVDGNNERKEVQGDGVVGEQPFIASGDSYRYSSGVILETPVGTMEGSYQMVGPDGDTFDAPIPAFVLAVPGALH